MKVYILSCILLLQTTFAVNGQNTLSTSFQFATMNEASKKLLIEDEYTKGWSQFDIDSRMQKKHSTHEEQMTNINSHLKEWTADEKIKINTQLNIIDEEIAKNKFKLPIPEKIILIKSTLKDEGGAEGYTRGNCIVLNENVMSMPLEKLRDILIHELFHILTRQNSTFRKNIYKVIGFNICNEIPYPDNLKNFKISNPDAPFKDSYITVKKDGKPIDCMMILYSKKPYEGGSFFEYINIGLLELKGDKTKQINYNKKHEPIVYEIEEVENFFEQIGRNTNYIIDPEEALADNFVFAINNKKGLPSQSIVDNIQALIK